MKTFKQSFAILVPKFDGNPFEFVDFIESFECWVHNTDAPQATKFQILLDNLDDEFELKNSLREFSSETYSSALAYFKDHFRTQTSNLSYLDDIDAVEDPENLKDLKTTQMELLFVWRSVNYFSLERILKSKLLKIVMEKFPWKYVEKFIRNNDLPNIKIINFLEYIRVIINKEEELRSKLSLFGLEHLRNRTNGEFSEGSSDQQYINYLQKYQNRQFFLSHLSPEDRARKIKKRNLCMNCLKKNHKAFKCRNDNNCTKCPRKHHTLLCKETKSIQNKEFEFNDSENDSSESEDETGSSGGEDKTDSLKSEHEVPSAESKPEILPAEDKPEIPSPESKTEIKKEE